MNEDGATKPNIATAPPERLQNAEKEFILDIKRAKRNGVDVAGVFLEVREQVMLAWVRMFGLMLGIIWVFLCPILIPLYRIYCFKSGLEYTLPEWYYYWPCAVGLVSILAFGFNLVDPRTLKRVKTEQQFLKRISLVHTDDSDGDV